MTEVSTVEDYPFVEDAIIECTDLELLHFEEYRQVAIAPYMDLLWCIGISTTHPPHVFVVDPNTKQVDVLGYTPQLPGFITHMRINAKTIDVVVSGPEGDDLYYGISRRDLSFDDPRGKILKGDNPCQTTTLPT